MNHTLRRLQLLPLPLGLGLLVAACGTTAPGTSPAPLAPAMGASLNQCAALTGQFRFEQAHIDSAESVAAGGLMLAGRPVAEHCLVKGAMHKRKGSDGSLNSAFRASARTPVALLSFWRRA